MQTIFLNSCLVKIVQTNQTGFVVLLLLINATSLGVHDYIRICI